MGFLSSCSDEGHQPVSGEPQRRAHGSGRRRGVRVGLACVIGSSVRRLSASNSSRSQRVHHSTSGARLGHRAVEEKSPKLRNLAKEGQILACTASSPVGHYACSMSPWSFAPPFSTFLLACGGGMAVPADGGGATHAV